METIWESYVNRQKEREKMMNKWIRQRTIWIMAVFPWHEGKRAEHLRQLHDASCSNTAEEEASSETTSSRYYIFQVIFRCIIASHPCARALITLFELCVLLSSARLLTQLRHASTHRRGARAASRYYNLTPREITAETEKPTVRRNVHPVNSLLSEVWLLPTTSLVATASDNKASEDDLRVYVRWKFLPLLR